MSKVTQDARRLPTPLRACLALSILVSAACQGAAVEEDETAVNEAAPVSATERAWSGSEPMQTPVFEIGSPLWRVRWKATETNPGTGVFHVVAFEEGAVYRTTVANILGAGEGVKEIEGGGRFYLSITGNQVAWEVEVEETHADSSSSVP